MHPFAINQMTRRAFLASTLSTGLTMAGAGGPVALAPAANKALIAVTLDLEMSRHYSTRDQMHWDYEKGNLDDATKRYAVEAARRVKAKDGVIHFFAVGQTMEQEDVGWLKEIVAQGPIIAAQAQAQPFVYPSGLIEVPMSPVSDVTHYAVAGGRLSLFWRQSGRV